MYILTTLEFPNHTMTFHLLTTSVNAKYYYNYYLWVLIVQWLFYLFFYWLNQLVEAIVASKRKPYYPKMREEEECFLCDCLVWQQQVATLLKYAAKLFSKVLPKYGLKQHSGSHTFFFFFFTCHSLSPLFQQERKKSFSCSWEETSNLVSMQKFTFHHKSDSDEHE